MTIRNQTGQVFIDDVLHISRKHLQTEGSSVTVGLKPSFENAFFDEMGNRVVVQFANKDHVYLLQRCAHIIHRGRRAVAVIYPVIRLGNVICR